jgi:hypothetical protein
MFQIRRNGELPAATRWATCSCVEKTILADAPADSRDVEGRRATCDACHQPSPRWPCSSHGLSGGGVCVCTQVCVCARACVLVRVPARAGVRVCGAGKVPCPTLVERAKWQLRALVRVQSNGRRATSHATHG